MKMMARIMAIVSLWRVATDMSAHVLGPDYGALTYMLLLLVAANLCMWQRPEP